MLVLGRKEGQSIHIGDDIVITVVRTRDTGVRIGIDAPKDINVRRSELIDERKAEEPERAAAAAGMGAVNDAA